MTRARATTILILIVATIGGGCAPSGDALQSERDAFTGHPGEIPAAGRVVYASGWQEIEMIANWAKTKIGLAGHFSTSRNACGKEEYGAIELSIWNALARSANAAIQEEPAPEEYCIPLPDGQAGQRYRVMDGVAEIRLENGSKFQLYESRGNEACTKIGNRQAAIELLEQLHKIVVIADEEGCPNGWGSA